MQLTERAQYFDLVPDAVKACVFKHEITLHGNKVPAMGYTTKGLKALGQSELVLSVLLNDQVENPPISPEPLQFFTKIYNMATQNQFYGPGGRTLLTGRFMDTDCTGMVYVPAEASTDLLSIILLKPTEMAMLERFGYMRVLVLLGRHYSYYPYPKWNDVSRESVIDTPTATEMMNSPLAQLPRITLTEAGCTMSGAGLSLRLPLSSKDMLAQVLTKLPPKMPLAISLGLDDRANSCLIWQPLSATAPTGISNGKGGPVVTCAPQIAFLPRTTGESNALISEDAFIATMDLLDWQEVREGLIGGQPINFKKGGFSLEVLWN